MKANEFINEAKKKIIDDSPYWQAHSRYHSVKPKANTDLDGVLVPYEYHSLRSHPAFSSDDKIATWKNEDEYNTRVTNKWKETLSNPILPFKRKDW